MAQNLTERVQASRLTVIEVLEESGTIKVRDAADRCSDLSCGPGLLVVGDDLDGEGIGALGPGDVIKVDDQADGLRRIVLVRRSWDEIGSPEF